jgi:hypothetical protein
MADEEKKLPTSKAHIQDADMDEAAKVHKKALDEVLHSRKVNKERQEKAKAEAAKKNEPAPEKKADVKPAAASTDNAPSPTADKAGVGGPATGPTATQAGTAAAAAK